MIAWIKRNWHQFFSIAAMALGAAQTQFGLLQGILSAKQYGVALFAVGVAGSILGYISRGTQQ
ncbi:MAG: hypothetical protein JSR67_03590 [Proteobacteria bacterium]|nr:hypothetical protein [Pseudomonadota bacterium]